MVPITFTAASRQRQTDRQTDTLLLLLLFLFTTDGRHAAIHAPHSSRQQHAINHHTGKQTCQRVAPRGPSAGGRRCRSGTESTRWPF